MPHVHSLPSFNLLLTPQSLEPLASRGLAVPAPGQPRQVLKLMKMLERVGSSAAVETASDQLPRCCKVLGSCWRIYPSSRYPLATLWLQGTEEMKGTLQTLKP